jgi:hypothetical protein
MKTTTRPSALSTGANEEPLAFAPSRPLRRDTSAVVPAAVSRT